MSSYPTEETLAKVSSDSAQKFIEWYYQDLNDSKPLAQYYVNANNKYATAGVTADITINGAHLANPGEYENLLEEQRGGPNNRTSTTTNGAPPRSNTRSSIAARVRHEVDSFDAQVINDDYTIGAPEHLVNQGPDRNGSRISMLVSVMGILHLGSGHDATRTTFNEVFVLVPNWDARGRNPPRNVKSIKKEFVVAQSDESMNSRAGGLKTFSHFDLVATWAERNGTRDSKSRVADMSMT